MAFSAFLDTCVLVPSTLRDLLLEVATHQGFRPLWSTGVEIELHRVITRLHADGGKTPEETTPISNVGQVLLSGVTVRFSSWVDG